MDHIDGGELVQRRQWRDQILLSFDDCCAYCREPLGSKATLDHVVPKAKGGLTVKHNLVACCLRCNREKAHQDWRVWYQSQSFFSLSQEAIIAAWLNG